MPLKRHKYFICKAPTLHYLETSTLVSPHLTPDSVKLGLGRQTHGRGRRVVGRTLLDHCAQEKQRGHEKLLEIKEQPWEGQARAGGKGLPSWRPQPELSALRGAKSLGAGEV